MKFHGLKLAVAAGVGLAFTAGATVAATPKSGGTLNIVVGSKSRLTTLISSRPSA